MVTFLFSDGKFMDIWVGIIFKNTIGIYFTHVY